MLSSNRMPGVPDRESFSPSTRYHKGNVFDFQGTSNNDLLLEIHDRGSFSVYDNLR